MFLRSVFLSLLLILVPESETTLPLSQHGPSDDNDILTRAARCQPRDEFCEPTTSDENGNLVPQQELLPAKDVVLPSCTLYVAPSTIPNGGLGVFTAIPLSPGDLLGGGGDIVISLQDIFNHPRSGLPQTDNSLENYSWDLRTVLLNLGYQRSSFPSVSKGAAAFVPGLESLINSNILLLNVAQAESAQATHDDATKDPSAFTSIGLTPYRNLSTVVTQPIPAGGELFTYYGDDWFYERDASIFESVPRSNDVQVAEDLLEDIRNLVDLIDNNDAALLEQVNNFLKPIPVDQRVRLQHILPKTVDDMNVALDLGLRAMHQQYAVRDMEELQEMGACLDHIIPKRSTVLPPQGDSKGNLGAFAATSIARGSIITTSPLLAVPNYKASLDHQVWNNITKRYETKKPHHRQSLPVLVNYCWSHVESTLLLCPYGTGVAYMNHAPSSAQINVVVKWSNRTCFPFMENKWLETDPVFWNHHSKSSTHFSAFLDYVAARDIQEGEELFVDYGKAWENAWNTFTRSNKNLKQGRNSDSANQLNLQHEVLRTEEEQDEQPYPAGISMRCHEVVFQSELPHTTTSAELWGSDHSSSSSSSATTTEGLPCQVLERHIHPVSLQITYAVRVIRPGSWQHPPQWVGRAGIPRAYIMLVDQKDDSHYEYRYEPLASSGFRHTMQLPDDMIPMAWRNVEASMT